MAVVERLARQEFHRLIQIGGHNFLVAVSIQIADRNREALPFIHIAMKNGWVTRPDLFMAMDPRAHWVSDVDRRFLQQFRSRGRRDPIVGVARANVEIVTGHSEQAEPILKGVVQQRPDQIDTQLLMGTVLMEAQGLIWPTAAIRLRRNGSLEIQSQSLQQRDQRFRVWIGALFGDDFLKFFQPINQYGLVRL